MSGALFNREFLAKTCCLPRLTPDDLYEGHQAKFAPVSSIIAKYNTIHDKITVPDA